MHKVPPKQPIPRRGGCWAGRDARQPASQPGPGQRQVAVDEFAGPGKRAAEPGGVPVPGSEEDTDQGRGVLAQEHGGGRAPYQACGVPPARVAGAAQPAPRCGLQLQSGRSPGWRAVSAVPRLAPETHGVGALQRSGGTVYLFDRRAVRFFRKDGHNWRKKADGKTVRETHEKLKARACAVRWRRPSTACCTSGPERLSARRSATRTCSTAITRMRSRMMAHR